MFEIPQGMARKVFDDKYARTKNDGTKESWSDVTTRVSAGNNLLFKQQPQVVQDYYKQVTGCEFGDNLQSLMQDGILVTAGRHLQHSDEDQLSKSGDRMMNCVTSITSFLNFWLLMQGCGVGRLYSSAVCKVDWDYMPNVRLVLDVQHPDYEPWIESLHEAKHIYNSESQDVRWYKVKDSAIGWMQVITILETAASEQRHKDKLFIFDFSDVRERGKPVRGMQNRPASGPVPFIRSMMDVLRVKGAGMQPWKQALVIDHCLAQAVLSGSIRRSARIACIPWTDSEQNVIDFITCKAGGQYFWSANNSVMVDEDFWRDVHSDKSCKARRIFDAVISASFYDKTGEPGFINVDKLKQNDTGIENLTAQNYLNPIIAKEMELHSKTYAMLDDIIRSVKKLKFQMIVNPCVTVDTVIDTTEGPQRVGDLVGKKFYVPHCGQEYKCDGFYSVGEQPCVEVEFSNGSKIVCSISHKFDVSGVPTEVSNLKVGDLVTQNLQTSTWTGRGTFSDGWLVGQVVGDGAHNPEKYSSHVRFWGEDAAYMKDVALSMLRQSCVKSRRDLTGTFTKGSSDKNSRWTVTSSGLTELVSNYVANVDGVKVLQTNDTSSDFARGFIQGMFDSDGTVLDSKQKGVSVRLSSINLQHLTTVSEFLSRLGIKCTIYKNRKDAGTSVIHGVVYSTQAVHELVVSRSSVILFRELINFSDPSKNSKLRQAVSNRVRGLYADSNTVRIVAINNAGTHEVYNCTVNQIHTYTINGIVNHQCGEISLHIAGGYCCIGDINLANLPKDQNKALQAVCTQIQFLLNVNKMRFLYDFEVNRTNRIGVGLIGVHEFAWNQFGYTFQDLLDENKSRDFWNFIDWMRVVGEAYIEGLKDEFPDFNIPHTAFTIKPAGTTAKIMKVTEGWHLPAYEAMIRYVQYRKDDPRVPELIAQGYPFKDVSASIRDTVVVGYPTINDLCDSMADVGVQPTCAGDVTMDQHFQWISLGEKHWLGDRYDNQISYTAKFKHDTTYEQYRRMMKNNMPNVKCCSVMPQLPDNDIAYSYQPETKISIEEYHNLMKRINQLQSEDYDETSLECAGGACPIEQNLA